MTEFVVRRSGKLPVRKSGLYASIPIKKYHSPDMCDGPAVSSSDLRLLWSKSPAHFYDKWRCNPNREMKPPTAEMILGSATHHLFLGEDHFNTLFVKRPDALADSDGDLVPWNSNRTDCKNWLKDQAKAGRTVLLPAQVDTIRGMGRSLSADPIIAQAGLLDGEIECSMIARDPATGLWLCARPDAIPTNSGDYADIKTTSDITDLGISRAISTYGLHQQGALVWECCELLGLEFTSFNLVFCETSRPYCVRIVPVTEEDLSRGRMQNRHAIRTIAQCLTDGRWPGPGGGDLRDMPLPLREREYIDSRLKAVGLI